MKPEDFIHMPIPASMFTAVCALLGGSAVVAAAAPSTGKVEAAKQATAPSLDINETVSQENPASDGTGETATTDASPSDSSELDAGGWPWSADMHASTQGKTKDGYWRMKVGVTRPANKPGFDAGSTSTESTGAAASTPSEDAATPAATSTADDDEFAAFREAAAKTDAEVAAVTVPARKWTDADLGALCNQAAVKLGDPAPVKALIAEYVAEGEVAHSRNIAEDKRAAFAAAVEAKAGITFAG